MNFRTEFALPSSSSQISLNSKIFSVGSCFAEVIGNKLQWNKFKVMINPFGVIFNPVSIAHLVETTLKATPVDQTLMVEREGIWYHYDFHSSISAHTPEQLAALISKQSELTSTFLHQANWVLITLGTAFVYQLKAHQQIVANCHKVPANSFSKELLSVTQVTHAIGSIYKRLSTINPDIRVILTVSPVRHIKEGIPENQVSKSILRVACHELTQTYNHIQYFPSYELMMDDLRDYRFYKKDMIHPTEVAEEYIWDKFAKVFTDGPARAFMKEWHSISQALTHKAFHAESLAHQNFLKQTLTKLKLLREEVNVEEEIRSVESRIRS
jgi:hypothetical protein